jgi:hypothetical protein
VLLVVIVPLLQLMGAAGSSNLAAASPKGLPLLVRA